MKYGISDKDLRSIQSVFARFPEIEQAVLYGSRAKGNYKNGSDIDIALMGDKLNLSHLAMINSQLYDLPIPYKVDVFLMKRIKNEGLIDHIKRVGKKLC